MYVYGQCKFVYVYCLIGTLMYYAVSSHQAYKLNLFNLIAKMVAVYKYA